MQCLRHSWANKNAHRRMCWSINICGGTQLLFHLNRTKVVDVFFTSVLKMGKVLQRP